MTLIATQCTFSNFMQDGEKHVQNVVLKDPCLTSITASINNLDNVLPDLQDTELDIQRHMGFDRFNLYTSDLGKSLRGHKQSLIDAVISYAMKEFPGVIFNDKKIEFVGHSCEEIIEKFNAKRAEEEKIILEAEARQRELEERKKLIFMAKKQSFSFSVVSPVAYVIGWTSEDVVDAIDTFNAHDIEGDRAGTTLRYMLVKLLEPSETTMAILEKNGILYEEVDPKQNELAEILNRLKELSFRDIIRIFGDAGIDILEVIHRKNDDYYDY